jgi:outer membrane receptor protein involved in Fe transport
VNSKLSYAIAVILGSSSAGMVHAATAAEADAGSDSIQEITVTAQRRTENMQDVPIQIQALTSETLKQLNVATFDDFVKYLPNVSAASNGPGQGSIYMRGLSTTMPGEQGSGGIGSFPNVAVYLDDQSGQLPGRNLDIYAADMERIEVLEGPQGTLFGAGAQAGVLRYITNKPKLDVTEGAVNAGYATTAHGDPSSNADGMINIPLIADTLAVRGVIYDDSRGGYINNVPGTFQRLNSDVGIGYAGGTVPANSVVINNSNLVGNAINPVTYKGIRVELLYKLNEDWNALLTQSYQNMEADGVFYETPASSAGQPLPDLSVQLYNPSYDKDRFENTSLTINGRVGLLKVVYTGGYLVRHVDQVGDYTNYARGVYADYYQCLSPAQTGGAGRCYSPSATWRDHETNSHDSQELRFSTPDDWRTRGILGFFWEDYTIHENIDWLYKTIPACTTAGETECMTDVGPAAGAQVNNPSIRNDNTSFFDDITRGYKQKAVFGSVDFDIIPKMLTFTAGTRYYNIDTTAVGSSISSFGCYADGPPPCTGNAGFSNDLSTENLNKSYSGFKSRANLTYKPVDDVLLYYTWSQGFRPGGFNRGSKTITKPDYTYDTPASYAPDVLTNNELGWKTQWFDHRLQFNGAVYQENWKNVQVELFESCCFGNLSFVTNGPNYRVRGAETEIIGRATHELTFFLNAAWNSSDLTNSPNLIGTNGAPLPITSPFGEEGSSLAQSPPFQGSFRARYETEFLDYKYFAQVGATHQAHSYSATGNIQTYVEAPFSTYDASVGVSKDAWNVQFYGQNLSDTRANLYENGNQFITAITVNRPRTLGVKIGYKF